MNIFISFLLIGAAVAAPLKVLYVLAPVPLKQSPTDGAKLVAIVAPKTSHLVLKFDKPIIADVEKSSEFVSHFKLFENSENAESSVLKLEVIDGNLKKPVVLAVKDKKSGEEVKVMVKMEE